MQKFAKLFNAFNSKSTLTETTRILSKLDGLPVLSKYRRLDSPIQFKIENIINANLLSYVYGSKQGDQ